MSDETDSTITKLVGKLCYDIGNLKQQVEALEITNKRFLEENNNLITIITELKEKNK